MEEEKSNSVAASDVGRMSTIGSGASSMGSAVSPGALPPNEHDNENDGEKVLQPDSADAGNSHKRLRCSEQEPAPPQRPGDMFDRQRVIVKWDQEKIEEQHAVIIGTGTVGCACALALVRMGVGSIVLFDMDVVDVTNLNRQILFTKDDVGKRKVDAAAEQLQRHNLRTKIFRHHCDVVKEWQTVIKSVSQATVVVNGADFGGMLGEHCVPFRFLWHHNTGLGDLARSLPQTMHCKAYVYLSEYHCSWQAPTATIIKPSFSQGPLVRRAGAATTLPCY